MRCITARSSHGAHVLQMPAATQLQFELSPIGSGQDAMQRPER
jgi:hypothetical protein